MFASCDIEIPSNAPSFQAKFWERGAQAIQISFLYNRLDHTQWLSSKFFYRKRCIVLSKSIHPLVFWWLLIYLCPTWLAFLPKSHPMSFELHSDFMKNASNSSFLGSCTSTTSGLWIFKNLFRDNHLLTFFNPRIPDIISLFPVKVVKQMLLVELRLRSNCTFQQ